MKRGVYTNDGQRLFVIPCDGGYTCLGFDVERFETKRLFAELGWPEPTAQAGTMNAWTEHKCALRATKAIHENTGKRFTSRLHEKLIGLEGKRVSCTIYGEEETFIVSRSKGWIPCHLMDNGSRWCDSIHARTEITNLRVIKC